MVKNILFCRAKRSMEYPYCYINNSTPSNKYPTVYFDGKMQYAHRLSYEVYKGSIPIGFEVDHLCFNTRCINPGHLQAVDPLENVRRANARPGGWHRGENNGNSKLNEDQVVQIKKLLKTAKLTYKEIAERFAVSSNTIGAIYRKQNWSHVK